MTSGFSVRKNARRDCSFDMSALMYGVKENDDPKLLNQHNDYPIYFRPNHKCRFKEGRILDREKMQVCLSLTPMLGSGNL